MPINPLDNTDSSSDDQGLLDQQKNTLQSGTNANAGGGGAGGGVSPAQKPSSSGFTNVNQYVQANADQAAGLGNKIASNVNQTASQGLQGLSQAQQQFNQQQQAAGVNPNDYSTDNVRTKINNDLSTAENNASDTGVKSDIQQFNDVQAKNTALQSGSDKAAKTLTDISSYAPADQILTQAQQAAGLTGTESGRATLLRGGTVQSADPTNPNAQIKISGGFQRPNYTTGQVNLDQLLTQNAPQNATTLNNLRTNLLGQYGLASQENAAIQNSAQTRQNTIQGTNQAEQNIQNVLYGAPADQTAAPASTIKIPGPLMDLAPGYVAGADGLPTPQAGILSNLYSQLLGQPATQNTQQSQNIASSTQQLTDYLKSAYGNNILGIPVAQLAQSIVTAQSPTGSANVTNTMSAKQLADLQTLNQFAGLNGTNINQIGKTGDSNLTVIDPTLVGQNQFNAGATENAANANAALQQGANAFQSNVNALFTNSGSNNRTVGPGGSYEGGTLSPSSYLINPGANSIFNGGPNLFSGYRLSDNLSGPSQYQSAIRDGTNALNTINGLEGTNIQLPQSYINAGQSSANALAQQSGKSIRSSDIYNAGLALAYSKFLSDLKSNPSTALGGNMGLNLNLAANTNIYGNNTAPSAQSGFIPTTNGGMRRPTG